MLSIIRSLTKHIKAKVRLTRDTLSDLHGSGV